MPLQPDSLLPGTDEDVCEKCHGTIEEGEERHMIYGATWCAPCADDRDQYDSPEDYEAHRG